MRARMGSEVALSIRTDPFRSESDHFGLRFLFDEAGVVLFDRFFQSGFVQGVEVRIPFKYIGFQSVSGAEPGFWYFS
jgi:hypothetical protein